MTRIVKCQPDAGKSRVCVRNRVPRKFHAFQCVMQRVNWLNVAAILFGPFAVEILHVVLLDFGTVAQHNGAQVACRIRTNNIAAKSVLTRLGMLPLWSICAWDKISMSIDAAS